MKPPALSALALLAALSAATLLAQRGDNGPDHRAMMEKLGITSPLRPGPAGRLNADGSAPPNFANYDESKSRAASPVPPLLVMPDGARQGDSCGLAASSL